MWITLENTLKYIVIFRDIEKFLKGYGYIRNISVKVETPSLDWNIHGTIFTPPETWLKLTSSNQWHLHFSSSNHGLLAHLHKFKESKPGPLPIIKLMAPSKYQNCGPPSKYQNCGTYSPSTFRKDTASQNLKIAGMPKTRLRWKLQKFKTKLVSDEAKSWSNLRGVAFMNWKKYSNIKYWS